MLCSSPWRRPQKAQIPQIETGPDRHSTPAPPPAPVPPSKDSGVTGNVLIYSAPSPCQRPGPGHLLVSRPEWVVRGEPPCPHVAGVEPGPTLPAAASVSPVRRLSPLFKGPCRVPQLRLGSRLPLPSARSERGVPGRGRHTVLRRCSAGQHVSVPRERTTVPFSQWLPVTQSCVSGLSASAVCWKAAGSQLMSVKATVPPDRVWVALFSELKVGFVRTTQPRLPVA